MSTASTKSTRKTKQKSGASPRGRIEDRADNSRAADISDRSWLTAAISILLIGAFLRLYDLPLVPLHHDEGVNGNFLVRLVRDGFYQYDPQNYHGPTLYYFAAIIPWTIRLLFGPAAQNAYGLTTFNIRLVPSLFGLGTIWLILLLRRRLGSIAVLAAAALFAISPGAVYLSRYFIHESLFVFFTLGIVVAGLKYYEEGRVVHLILASASAALLFATKETWIISVGVLLIALVSTHLYRWLGRAIGAGGSRSGVDSPASLSDWTEETIERLGGKANIAIWSLVAIAVFATIGVLFYSSFLTNSKGIWDSLETFQVWGKTGQTAHVHPRWTYVAKWLAYQESLVLVLGAIGAAIVVWKPKNSFALFTALWAFGIIAAYSLVPYKTPWLMLNFLIPLALIGGYAVEWIYRRLREYQITSGVAVLTVLIIYVMISGLVPNGALIANQAAEAARLRGSSLQMQDLALAFHEKKQRWKVAIPGFQTVDLNFINYDNDDEYYVYVYAHTKRDTLKLLANIERVARQSGAGKEIGITIVSPDYWPLPWYFRDDPRVGYFGHMAPTTEPIIIASESQSAEVQATFGDQYRQINSTFALRPGVELLLLVRRDLPSP